MPAACSALTIDLKSVTWPWGSVEEEYPLCGARNAIVL